MPSESWQDRMQLPLRVLQIVVFALATGCAFFTAIAVFISLGESWPWRLSPITLLALIFGGCALFARLVVPSLIVAQGRKKIPEQQSGVDKLDANLALQLMGLLSTRTILAGALLEGVIFFLLIAFLVEHSPIALAAAALLWLLLVALFPTQRWGISWIEDQWRLLREEQSLRH
jgi:MFS family permease